MDHLSAFEGVCSQMLEDVQERFVYRTHIYIREEILNYNPSSGDLTYPEKLEIMEQIASQIKKSEEATGADKTSLVDKRANNMSPADAHGMWYPTLKRTLICLSKLYRCLDVGHPFLQFFAKNSWDVYICYAFFFAKQKKIFEGLAQETLSMCIQSLSKASDTIKRNKTATDGELFLIKHLLILREQIAPFNNDFSVVEVHLDFTRIRDAAYGLMGKKDKFFRLDRDNAFLDFLLNVILVLHAICLWFERFECFYFCQIKLQGTLEAKENTSDSKREVDAQLKSTCEAFIENVSEDLFGSIKNLVKQVRFAFFEF